MKLKLTITGTVPSKKNQKQIAYVRGRPIIVPSQNHRQWLGDAIKQLYGTKPMICPVSVVITLYPVDRRKGDLTNKAESVMDLLVDAGILEDDNWFAVPDVHLKFGGVDPKNPRAEVEISN